MNLTRLDGKRVDQKKDQFGFIEKNYGFKLSEILEIELSKESLQSIFLKYDLAFSNLLTSFSDSLIPNISLNSNALITALPP